MTMSSERILFGTELRRRRTGAGLSLAGLAKLVHYSKSHLSKVETGGKSPSVDLARRCDAALCCDGTLARLVRPTIPRPRSAEPPAPPAADATVLSTQDSGEVWVLVLGANDSDRFGVLSRREVLAGGAAAAGLAMSAGLAAPAPARAGESTLASFRDMFDQLRSLGQHLGATVLVPMLVTHTHALRRLAADSGPAQRGATLRLAARFAEYTGWMTQEAGDDDRAMWWTDRAVEMAAAGGDTELAAYAYVRRALVTLYRDDPIQTVVLAGRAESASRSPRIRGLAAQRQAQGHAIAGEAAACHRALDRAAELLARSEAEPDPGAGPTIGTSHVLDPVALARGWCLVDLGQPAQAAEILSPELARISGHALRARARVGARLALAHAGSGELERACDAVEPVLTAYERIGSATVRTDLRHLARNLNRWHGNAAVRDTRLRLTTALSAG